MNIAERIERVRLTAANEDCGTLREHFNAQLDFQPRDKYTKFRDWEKWVKWDKGWAQFGRSTDSKR